MDGYTENRLDRLTKRAGRAQTEAYLPVPRESERGGGF